MVDHLASSAKPSGLEEMTEPPSSESPRATVLRVIAWVAFGFIVLTGLCYIRMVIFNSGIVDNYITGPAFVIEWYFSGAEFLFGIILFGVLIWLGLIALAKRAKRVGAHKGS
jgi:hypothetical protein